MHCLVIGDTFPNWFEPGRGPYNRRQFECLAEHCHVTVINPISVGRLLENQQLATLIDLPDITMRRVDMYHPVMWHLPVFGRDWTWRGVLHAAEEALETSAIGGFDVVVATFAYPQGLAAARLAEATGTHCVIKVRGSDIHSLPAEGRRRELTAEALQGADAVVAVSQNLADTVHDLGVPTRRIHVLPNGIDADCFPVIERGKARRRLGISQECKLLLFVGGLLPVKGVDVLIEALKTCEMRAQGDVRVAVVGSGRLQKSLERQVACEGLGATVRFVGQQSRKEVAMWMNAADLLSLPSRNEGCPNVVLEALCCGTPVVATCVGAVPELVDDSCGAVVPPEDPHALGRALATTLGRTWDRNAIRGRVARHSWSQNATNLHHVLSGVAGLPVPRPAPVRFDLRWTLGLAEWGVA